jgi:hypothetical protein
MSRETELAISVARLKADGREAVRDLLRLTGAEEVSIASRSASPARRAAPTADDLEDDHDQILGYDVKVDEIPALYQAGLCLELDVGSCPLSRSLRAAVKAKVSPELSGEFAVNGVHLRVGAHWILQVDEDDEVVPVGRYEASLILRGHGSPNDPDGVRESIRKLPPFEDLVNWFKTRFGPPHVSLVVRF